jgi:hypothetical protein
VDDVKISAVILNHMRGSPSARDASGNTPLNIALQHGSSSVACFIVTRAPDTHLINSPDRNQPTVVDAITHWHCSCEFISVCISVDSSILFKLFNGRDLCSWSISAGRNDITNLLKRNQATLRALTGIQRLPSKESREKSSMLVNSYSLKETG